MSRQETHTADRACPTPLVAEVSVEVQADGRAVSTYHLQATEPVLTGHYPGFPIFPGVCLVECAHRTSLAVLSNADVSGGPPIQLAAIESARFTGPVFPGDKVRTEVTAQVVEDGWRCHVRQTAELSTGGSSRKVAVIRLRYGTRAR